MESASDIAKWYHSKSVFVTGATGFMGKVLVEKLLRSCADIGTIYLLIRGKTGVSMGDRISEIIRSSLFDKLRDSGMNLKERLVGISGDLALPDLGISKEDRHLLQHSVSVVFHAAATIRFHEPLRGSVTVNLDGTEAVMQLCRGMTNLCAVVYVSTAYANCDSPVIQERIYPPPMSLERLKHCLAGLDDDLLELITPRLIGKHPNAYTFTKALAEHTVAGYSKELPIVVVRPSIVTSTWKEPRPGWVGNYGGPVVFMIGIGKGLLKSVYGSREAIGDLIPVDMCINLIIAAAWEIGNKESAKLVPDVLTYNCVSGQLNPINWGSFFDEVTKCSNSDPMEGRLTRPALILTNSRIMHNLTNFHGQIIPAHLVDWFTWISGGMPRLLHYVRKVNRTAASAEFFTSQGWEIEAENMKLLMNKMSPVDREIFDFDVTKIDWKEYIRDYFTGIRVHLLQEKTDRTEVIRSTVTEFAFTKNKL